MIRTLSPTLAAFYTAVADFRTRVERVPTDIWDRPRSQGKWSPAEETEHVVLSHELFRAQLDGGPAMRVITTGWRRLALRWLVLPFILRTGRFPRARAPRESRPSGAGERHELLARLARATSAVLESIARDEAIVMRRRLSHPYFGMMGVKQVVRLLTVHTRHHARRLPADRSMR